MSDTELFDDIIRTYPSDAKFMFEKSIKDQTIKLPVYLLNRYIKGLTDKREIEILKSLAKQADKEYDRSEIDNWTFSLGSLAHERLLKLEYQLKSLNSNEGNGE